MKKSVTISNKYQVVIPKDVRKKLNIHPGQTVYVSADSKGDVRIKTSSAIDELYGSMKGVWGKDSDSYLNKMRDEWDAPRG